MNEECTSFWSPSETALIVSHWLNANSQNSYVLCQCRTPPSVPAW